MKSTNNPDSSAVRTALWRALHVRIDAPPHIVEDEIGFQLVDPEPGWEERPDMKYTKRLRASIVARSRLVEDLLIEQSQLGIRQCVILGAGLDTFALRHPVVQLQIYEIDQPGTLHWKEERIQAIGYAIPPNLHLVPVDFEKDPWKEKLFAGGFDSQQPAVIVSTGLTLYLTKEAIIAMLDEIATLPTGSIVAIAFYLPTELLDEEDRQMQALSQEGAQRSGTPFRSFFGPAEVLAMAEKAGLQDARLVSRSDIEQRYFTGRSDDLQPASGEIFLLARTAVSNSK